MKIILQKNFYNEYCYITPQYEYYWGWNCLEVHLNSDLLDIKQVQISPELVAIVLNSKYKDIFKKLFQEKINEKKCNETYFGYYCDKDVDIDIGELKFEIKRKGIKFSLGSKDLFMEYNNKLFFLIKFDARFEINIAKLGYPFIKKYDMILNIDSRHMGFYNFKIKYQYKKEESEINGKNENQNNEENKKEEKNDNSKIIEEKNNSSEKKEKNKNNENTTTKVLFILLLIFFSILVIYCIFTVFSKCERKRKGKIFEELFL